MSDDVHTVFLQRGRLQGHGELALYSVEMLSLLEGRVSVNVNTVVL